MADLQKSGKSYLIPENSRINNFDFMRIAMAVLVVWSHSFAIYYGSEANEPVSLILNGVYNSGNIAVRVFFCISGFLVAASYIKSSSNFSYFSKRIKRIFPGFLMSIFICSFIIIPAMSSAVDLSMFQVSKTIVNAFILRAEFPPSNVFYSHQVSAVNGALWSIPFEFWCYIGIAVLGLAKVLKSGLIVLSITLGIIATRIFLDIYGLKLTEALLPLSLAYLIFYFAFSSIKMPDAKRGDFSYGTYLYGFPIQQMLVTVSLPFWLYVLIAILLSVCAGILSWSLVERHFLPASRRNHDANAIMPPVVTQPSATS